LFTTLSGDQEVPPVITAATGVAASTVNRDTGEITLHLNATGADDATGAHIHDGFPGENGGVIIPLTQDEEAAGHWFAEGAQFDADGLAAYLSGRLYVNLHTPANPGGEIRGQIVPPDAAPPDDTAPSATLTEIQEQVFTPLCSGCHSGPTSTNLPSGMNLGSTAESFAALVSVASLQVPQLNRVEAGDPDSSYLIDKLEGTQTVGSRMPQGGPFLDQETIDLIREWITNGAENN
jgi:mono/diheme cytochrome c family protein